jgi:hypothetical protein
VIDESSAFFKNFLLQLAALQLPPLASEIVLAHLHAADRTATRARFGIPRFSCRDQWVYVRTTGDPRTEAAGVPALVIAYMLNEAGENDALLEPLLIDLLSRHETGDADPLLPAEMVQTLLDFIAETGEAPESLRSAVEQILGDILGGGGH